MLNKNIKQVIFYINVPLISIGLMMSCAPIKSIDSIEAQKGDIPLHGQFCGPNFPDVRASNRADEIILLQKIQFIDIIDETCKAHDICYVRYDDNLHKYCDLILMRQASALYNKLKNDRCKTLVQYIFYTFRVKNIDQTYEFDDRKYPLGALSRLGEKIESTLNYGILNFDVGLTGIGGNIVGLFGGGNDEYMKKITNNKHAMLPGRFEVCKI